MKSCHPLVRPRRDEEEEIVGDKGRFTYNKGLEITSISAVRFGF